MQGWESKLLMTSGEAWNAQEGSPRVRKNRELAFASVLLTELQSYPANMTSATLLLLVCTTLGMTQTLSEVLEHQLSFSTGSPEAEHVQVGGRRAHVEKRLISFGFRIPHDASDKLAMAQKAVCTSSVCHHPSGRHGSTRGWHYVSSLPLPFLPLLQPCLSELKAKA